MQLLRLPGRKNCDRVRTKGALWKGKHLFVRWLHDAPKNLDSVPVASAVYVGSIASTKLDKSAVKRNRMRRRCREALRLALKQRAAASPNSVQLLLLPRSSSLSCAFDELATDIAHFLSSVRL